MQVKINRSRCIAAHERRTLVCSYEKAEKYLRDVLKGRFDPKKSPPVTMWKAEIAKLTARFEKAFLQKYS